ncbi:Uncharacterised protein [Vibrio cholerae]|nr:Uncharacterised protein [Vibrio cholerae]
MRKPAIVYSLCKTSLVIHGAEWPHEFVCFTLVYSVNTITPSNLKWLISSK